jgi:hypothetical protein
MKYARTMTADEVDEVVDYILEEVKPFARTATRQLLTYHVTA